MLEEAYHVEEIHVCVLWYHEDGSRQLNIGNTLLQLEDDSIDGVHGFL